MTSVDAIGMYAEAMRQAWNACDPPDDALITDLVAYADADELARMLDCRIDLLWHPNDLCAPHRLWIADWLASFWTVAMIRVIVSQRQTVRCVAETSLAAVPMVSCSTTSRPPPGVAGRLSAVTPAPGRVALPPGPAGQPEGLPLRLSQGGDRSLNADLFD